MLQENTLRVLSSRMQDPEWLLGKRLESFRKFNELDFPWFKYGLGIDFDVRKLELGKVDPSFSSDEVVIKNSEECEILDFKEAVVKYGDKIKAHLFSEDNTSNKLTSLHRSFFNNGLFIRVPAGKVLEKPLQINLDLKSNSRIDYVFVIAEKNSVAEIIEFSKSDDSFHQRFRSELINVIVEEGAKVEYKSVQNFGRNVINFVGKLGKVERDGALLWIDCCLGSGITQNNTKTFLVGDGADGKSWGVAYGDKSQAYDIGGETIHIASNTTSDMVARVVLNDEAKTVYRGLVRINPGAMNCEGYQQEDSILLSEKAEASTVPNLEIENNDVKCSHGATVTQIDEDKLFYMMCRGIDEHSAKNVIVEGFFEPIVASIEDEEIKSNINESLKKRLEAIE